MSWDHRGLQNIPQKPLAKVGNHCLGKKLFPPLIEYNEKKIADNEAYKLFQKVSKKSMVPKWGSEYQNEPFTYLVYKRIRVDVKRMGNVCLPTKFRSQRQIIRYYTNIM